MNRRQILAAAAPTLAAAPSLAKAQTQGDPAPPALEFAFTAHVLLGPIVEFGSIGGVRKRLVPITGGSFKGPRLQGEVLNGGGDWQSVAADGSAEIHARYTLKTADGVVIAIDNPGIRRGPAAVLQRLAAGEAVDPSLYYFRTTPRFDVADGPHQWLREALFVGVGVRNRDSVDIHYYRLG